MDINLNLDALLVLDTIARRGSFSAAAEELHRVPSSVTYAIQKLEARLGVTLFDRRGHRARLTPAGEELLRGGRDLLTLADGVARNVQRVATGWEAELRIAVGDVIPYERVLELCEAFYRIVPDTRLRLSTEVLGGTWDALVSERADLVIGAPGDGPAGGGYSLRPLGDVEFVFAVAPHHPLAAEPEPLTNEQIRRHRAVAAADSSRGLPPRTVGLLPGQQVFTVPDLHVKRQAQKWGLGVGYLPRHLIAEDITAGDLVVKATEEASGSWHTLYYAWRTRHQGKALAWFRRKLSGEGGGLDWFSGATPQGGDQP